MFSWIVILILQEIVKECSSVLKENEKTIKTDFGCISVLQIPFPIFQKKKKMQKKESWEILS